MSPEDPYTGLLLEVDKRAQSQQSPGMLLGTVLDVGEGRLVIRAGGMTLDEQDLMVDAHLLARKEVPFRITIQVPGEQEKGEEVPQSSVTLDVGGTSVRTHINTGDTIITSIPLWELPGTLTGTVTGTVTLESERLAAGDQVLLLPDAEGQTYYVLFKVVRP